MLELKDITKKYQIGETYQQVLKGISISFRKKEFASILGASGSGKTTLLNIIGGLDQYDYGDLIMEGVSTKKYTDRDWDSYRNYRVGFIFQNYNLIAHQTILSNVEIALTLSGISTSERKSRAIEVLKKVGLENHIHKRPNQLSGGQMQRVAIARALVNNPEIILADEPTGALDSETSIQIMELLKEIAQEKLVIMVTHNPELAKKYSTRIIELKDGKVIEDTAPYEGEEKNTKEKKIWKTSMSLWTALGLSFHNLLTKKGRTILTAFAGSIGIIGIALILSLSNGVSNYVVKMEQNSLSDYPITFERTSYDFTKLFQMEEIKEIKCEENKLCSTDDISSQIDLLTEGLVKKNNLHELKKFLDNHKEMNDYVTEIQYGYHLDLQIYSNQFDHYTRLNPNHFNVLGNGELHDEEMLSVTTETTPVFTELLDNEELLNSKYEVMAGHLPKAYNELVLMIGKDSVIPDSILYALDIKDRRKLNERLDKNIKEEVDSTIYSYEDILNLSYKLILNTDYYKQENGVYRDYSNDTQYMKNIIESGLTMKVVGIIRAKDDASMHNVIGYQHSLTEYVISEIAKTDIYKEQVNQPNINVLTKEAFDGFTNTYEKITNLLGIADLENPDVINIYPKDFSSKEKIIQFIEQYNEMNTKNNQMDLVVSYTDLLKTVVSGVTSIINIISFVLIGFVAISLIVSSIMIAIITYISVLERTKEIGILRAIGASKKDISRVFKSETIIEGLMAGVLGIGIALFLSIPINLLVSVFAGIDGIARMPLGGAIFLILLSIGLNVLAGHIPSKMASKKDPVIALRSE